MKVDRYIGIDADIDKSGVAVWNPQTQSFDRLECLTFWQLYDYLCSNYHPVSGSLTAFVRLEAGWLNKSNWHVRPNQSQHLAAKIGQGTGQNHATGKHIEQMLKHIGIPYELIQPKRSKVTDAAYFNKLTGITTRTNQEKRDAAMLVFGMK